jgi:hypothetical protein
VVLIDEFGRRKFLLQGYSITKSHPEYDISDDIHPIFADLSQV